MFGVGLLTLTRTATCLEPAPLLLPSPGPGLGAVCLVACVSAVVEADLKATTQGCRGLTAQSAAQQKEESLYASATVIPFLPDQPGPDSNLDMG